MAIATAQSQKATTICHRRESTPDWRSSALSPRAGSTLPVPGSISLDLGFAFNQNFFHELETGDILRFS
jgi:hypothetical protein